MCKQVGKEPELLNEVSSGQVTSERSQENSIDNRIQFNYPKMRCILVMKPMIILANVHKDTEVSEVSVLVNVFRKVTLVSNQFSRIYLQFDEVFKGDFLLISNKYTYPDVNFDMLVTLKDGRLYIMQQQQLISLFYQSWIFFLFFFFFFCSACV